MKDPMALPPLIEDESALEDQLSRPDAALAESLGRLTGDIVVLGAGGKMGLSLARMARRAFDIAGSDHRVFAVSRFSDLSRRAAFEAAGIETVSADLLERAALDRLPDGALIVAMAGQKFGTAADTPRTWASNVILPVQIMRRYEGRRVVAFSSGNIYGLVPITSAGSRVGDVPHPVGEYAMSVLGRERIYEYFAMEHGTPTALIRLNYACELRYGVLVDIAGWVWHERPVPLAMGYFNVIWQGDANRMTLRAWEHASSPASIFNVTGPERIAVRDIATWFGRRWGKEIAWDGEEAGDALLADTSGMSERLGGPHVPLQQMLEWIANWFESNNTVWNKPTHFENRVGDF